MWIWNQYELDITYHQKHYSGILGNKDKIWRKVLGVTFPSRKILWKDTLHGYNSYWRKTEQNLELTWGIPQSLGWWPHSHHCSKSLWYSITYHVYQWIHECSSITWFPYSETWHGIYHASSKWTYNVFNKGNFQIK